MRNSWITAGIVATIVMSAYMMAGESREAIGTPPPARIVRRLHPSASEHGASIAATLLHLGIGAAGGVLGRVLARRLALPAMTAALALWAVGYEFVAPALGVLPPAHRDSRRARHLLRAHVVYGLALGALRRVR